MIPIAAFVGKSNSGKTTLIEKVIGELTRRKYRVVSIKHTLHAFEIDHEGKDTWHHRKAGAVMTMISSPAQIAVIESVARDYSIEELCRRFVTEADIVLVEGHKETKSPKVEVSASESIDDLLCLEDEQLIAIACDTHLGLHVPCYPRHRGDLFADLIEQRFLKGT
ncbi:MAG: molybdopterin-guanine dinucleotide biosynthesis protein B [Deltaproteobacteria bacterium]|nr:molybdopterin-guanine dinucleotide biosynthesis protein B [Deltaproteobacteria bacterium]